MMTTRLMTIGHTGRQTMGIESHLFNYRVSRKLLSNYVEDRHFVFF